LLRLAVCKACFLSISFVLCRFLPASPGHCGSTASNIARSWTPVFSSSGPHLVGDSSLPFISRLLENVSGGVYRDVILPNTLLTFILFPHPVQAAASKTFASFVGGLPRRNSPIPQPRLARITLQAVVPIATPGDVPPFPLLSHLHQTCSTDDFFGRASFFLGGRLLIVPVGSYSVTFSPSCPSDDGRAGAFTS